MATNDNKAARLMTALVQFKWGNTPTISRYAGSNSDLTVTSFLYSSCPALEITTQTIAGDLADQTWEVIMPPLTPLDVMINSLHPPTEIRVAECDPLDPDATYKLWYTGLIERTIFNPLGNPGLVKVQFQGHRVKFNASLGIMGASTCQWTFGDENGSPCGFPLSTIRQSGPVSLVLNNTLTVTGITAPLKGKWIFGEARYDGLSLRIRDVSYSGGSAVFVFDRDVPPWWLGKTVLCTPGCDKRPNTCEQDYNNIRRFMGFGLRMPTSNRTIYAG